MIHLDHRDNRPIYIQIVDGFRKKIEAGVLKSGDRIPSVRELAAELTINPNTIQRAYRELEAAGWIVSVTGKGSFVSPGHDNEQQLLTRWDKLTASLIQLGFSREELAERILRGGNENA